MMSVAERDEGGSQKEDEWSRSDNNRRREERDHDSRDRKGGRDFGNKNRYQEGREHHNGNGNGSREQREKKNPGREEHARLRGYDYSAATSKRMNNPTEGFADSGVTQHITGNRDLLVNFVPAGPERWMVSGIREAKLAVSGQGDVYVKVTFNGITLEGNVTESFI